LIPPTSPNGAWFYSGENGFILSFRTGEAPNENTGLMQFDSSSVAFDGLYGVREIVSSFRDGKFSQMLKAMRDPLIRNSTILRSQILQTSAGSVQNNRT
jgi:hypothetical protein